MKKYLRKKNDIETRITRSELLSVSTSTDSSFFSVFILSLQTDQVFKNR